MSKDVQDRFYINIPGMDITRAALRDGEIRFEKYANHRGIEYWGTKKDAVVMLEQVIAQVTDTLAKLGVDSINERKDKGK